MPPMRILPMRIMAVPRRGHRLLVAVCFIAGLVGRSDTDQPVLSEYVLRSAQTWSTAPLATWLGVSRAWFGSFYVRSD